MASKESHTKKSFEFRMSKKVAELTQVVHMLFTRNHEKEVELEALKEAYEYEIDLVIKDAKSRIERLEEKLQKSQRTHGGEREQARIELAKEMAEREDEWKRRVCSIEQQLVNEKRECQIARDLLIQAQNDIEKLKEGQSGELNTKTRELDATTRECNQLKQMVANMEKRLREGETTSSSVQQELHGDNEKLRRELKAMQDTLREQEKAKEQLLAKNKQLENMRKELARKAEQSARSSAGSRAGYRLSTASMDYAEEVERLRREVQRYRNELCNREENFNRMFTEQHPVLVDRRAGRLHPGPAEPTDPRPPPPPTPAALLARQPTFSLSASYPTPTYSGSPGPSTVGGRSSSSRTDSRTDDYYTLSPRPEPTTITARLPNLGLENRRHGAQQAARLAKPRPLPREMLSAKAGGHG